MPSPRTVTSTQLTLLMLTLIIVPVLSGIALYWNAPRVAEPLLPVQMKIASTWLEESQDAPSDASRRLVQCIVLKNDSGTPLGKLSIGINDQFFSTGNKVLQPGQEISIPLESFIARNGSVRFPVGNRPIHKATVFAQIGVGARGVSEFFLVGDEQTGPTQWKSPSPTGDASED